MEQWEEDKLNLLATYLVKQIPGAHAKIEPFETASSVYVLTVKTPKQQHRLGVCRPLNEDRNRSVSEVQALMLRDGLAHRLQAFNREEYNWNPIA